MCWRSRRRRSSHLGAAAGEETERGTATGAHRRGPGDCSSSSSPLEQRRRDRNWNRGGNGGGGGVRVIALDVEKNREGAEGSREERGLC